MPIFNRIRRLFRADLHAILDSLEDPQTLLKQALREMEEALDRKQKTLTLKQRQLQGMETSSTRTREKISRLDQDLQLALVNSTEEVCRKVIGRKLLLQKQLAHLEQEAQKAAHAAEALARELQKQQEEYESIRERAEHLIVPPPDDSPESLAESILSPTASPIAREGYGVSEEEVELEWIRLRQAQGGAS